jgi:hypothetical protein
VAAFAGYPNAVVLVSLGIYLPPKAPPVATPNFFGAPVSGVFGVVVLAAGIGLPPKVLAVATANLVSFVTGGAAYFVESALSALPAGIQTNSRLILPPDFFPSAYLISKLSFLRLPALIFSS